MIICFDYLIISFIVCYSSKPEAILLETYPISRRKLGVTKGESVNSIGYSLI